MTMYPNLYVSAPQEGLAFFPLQTERTELQNLKNKPLYFYRVKEQKAQRGVKVKSKAHSKSQKQLDNERDYPTEPNLCK